MMLPSLTTSILARRRRSARRWRADWGPGRAGPAGLGGHRLWRPPIVGALSVVQDGGEAQGIGFVLGQVVAGGEPPRRGGPPPLGEVIGGGGGGGPAGPELGPGCRGGWAGRSGGCGAHN